MQNLMNSESIIDDVKNIVKILLDIFIIAKFYEEYTVVMNNDKTYMIKGVNDNLDNVISYKDLPKTVIMTILPFKDMLINDSVIMELGIKMGINFDKIVNDELSKSVKFYHL